MALSNRNKNDLMLELTSADRIKTVLEQLEDLVRTGEVTGYQDIVNASARQVEIAEEVMETRNNFYARTQDGQEVVIEVGDAPDYYLEGLKYYIGAKYLGAIRHSNAIEDELITLFAFVDNNNRLPVGAELTDAIEIDDEELAVLADDEDFYDDEDYVEPEPLDPEPVDPAPTRVNQTGYGRFQAEVDAIEPEPENVDDLLADAIIAELEQEETVEPQKVYNLRKAKTRGYNI